MVFNLVPITGTFAGILGGYYMVLSVRVIKERFAHKCMMGDGTTETLKAIIEKSKENKISEVQLGKYNKLYGAIRAHGNFFENVPLILILTMIAEMHGASSVFLKTLLGLFTLGRISHVEFGITNPTFMGWGRKFGTISTYLTLLCSSVGCVYLSNKSFFDSLLSSSK
eukprot:gene4153-5194_t